MSPSEVPPKWIVTTTAGQGAWCDHKPSALSLINSHSATQKANTNRDARRLSGASRAGKQQQKQFGDSALFKEHVQRKVIDEDAPDNWSIEELTEVFGENTSSCEEIPPSTSSQGQRPVMNSRSRSTRTSSLMNSGAKQALVKSYPPSKTGRHEGTFFVPFYGIQAGLRPPIRFATHVESWEQELLHFFLKEGRKRLLGTTTSPVYCPALHIAQQGTLERSPVYVFTHIAMAEYLFCELTKTSLSTNFYRRRAHAYQAVHDLLLDPDADFDELLCALVMMQIAEFAFGQRDLQSMHLEAIHQLVERRGITRSFLLARDPTSVMVTPQFYVTQFIYADYTGPVKARAIVGPFIDSLRRIRRWVQTCKCARVVDEPAAVFLQGLLKGADPIASSRDLGNFMTFFSLCMTFVEFDMSAESCKKFLQSFMESLQQSMQASKEATREVCKAHSCITIHLITHHRRSLERPDIQRSSYRRYQYTQMNLDLEVLICESSIEAVKLFPRLGDPKRCRLTETMLKCALAAVEPTLAEGLSEPDLDDLEAEILANTKS